MGLSNFAAEYPFIGVLGNAQHSIFHLFFSK